MLTNKKFFAKQNEVFSIFSQSYLDWLPPEIQVYIMLFAASQNFIDIKNKVETERETRSIRQRLREEIITYGEVKNEWGLGHIQVKCTKPECEYCEERQCVITGYYRDYYELTKQNVYLGHSYKHALSRLNHVKSFLLSRIC